MNWLSMMRKKFPLMIWRIVLTALSIFSMTSMVGLFRFDARAAVIDGVTVSPLSCSIGDTITVSVSGGSSQTQYLYSYRIDPDTSYTLLTGWTFSSTFDYTPTFAGTYDFKVWFKDTDTQSYIISSSVTVSEISAESSAESSSESSAESSIPLPFLPSDWEGNAFVQPSAESTPTLDLSLPSDVQLSVPSGIGGVLSSAFQAFPAPLLALIIPSVICLFIGWWLHK